MAIYSALEYWITAGCEEEHRQSLRAIVTTTDEPVARDHPHQLWVMEASGAPQRVLALASWENVTAALTYRADSGRLWLRQLHPFIDRARSPQLRAQWFSTVRESVNFSVMPTIAVAFWSHNDPTASGAFRVWARTAQDRAIRLAGVASCRTIALDTDPAVTITLAEFADRDALGAATARMAETPCPVPISDLRRYEGAVWSTASSRAG